MTGNMPYSTSMPPRVRRDSDRFVPAELKRALSTGGPGPMIPKRLWPACSIVAYSACSATLLLVNKLTMAHLPSPALVTVSQLVVTAGTVAGGADDEGEAGPRETPSGRAREIEGLRSGSARDGLVFWRLSRE